MVLLAIGNEVRMRIVTTTLQKAAGVLKEQQVVEDFTDRRTAEAKYRGLH